MCKLHWTNNQGYLELKMYWIPKRKPRQRAIMAEYYKTTQDFAELQIYLLAKVLWFRYAYLNLLLVSVLQISEAEATSHYGRILQDHPGLRRVANIFARQGIMVPLRILESVAGISIAGAAIRKAITK